MTVGQDKIIEFIRQKGPLLPSTLAKAIGTDILIASAHLSDLSDQKKVFISHTKVGGSPLYYVEGQKSKLQNFMDNLNEKDQKTCALLKTEKVLKDVGLDQLTRVSLRIIKDFAIPLQVSKGEEKILFWKWFLLSNQEAEVLIKGILENTTKPQNTIEEERAKLQQQNAARTLEEEQKIESQKKGEEEKKKLAQEEKRIQEEKKLSDQKKIELERLKVQAERKKEDEKRKLEEKRIQEERKRHESKIEEERRGLEEEKKKFLKEKEDMQKQLEQERQSLLKNTEKKVEKKVEDNFYNHLMEYFNNKKISIVENKIIRKESEVDFILKIPSVVGDLEFYCKSKNKKNVSDSDLSSAVVQGQLKKLPVLFLTTGELSKKAKEFLSTELKRGLVIKKI